MDYFQIGYAPCNGCQQLNQVIFIRKAFWCGVCLNKIIAESWLICKEFEYQEMSYQMLPLNLQKMILELNYLFLGARSGETTPAPDWVTIGGKL